MFAQAREAELEAQKKAIEVIKSQYSASPEREMMETELTQLLMNIEKVQTSLSNHRDYVENKLVSLKKYMHSLDAIMAWVMETRTRLNISRELPQQENIKVIDNIMVS